MVTKLKENILTWATEVLSRDIQRDCYIQWFFKHATLTGLANKYYGEYSIYNTRKIMKFLGVYGEIYNICRGHILLPPKGILGYIKVFLAKIIVPNGYCFDAFEQFK